MCLDQKQKYHIQFTKKKSKSSEKNLRFCCKLESLKIALVFNILPPSCAKLQRSKGMGRVTQRD